MSPARRPLAVVLLLLSLGLARAAAQSPAGAESAEARAEQAFSSGRAAEAVALLEPIADERRRAGDRAGEARVRWRLSVGYRSLGDRQRAASSAGRAFELATAADATAIAAEALGQLHLLQHYPARYPSARSALDEALRLAEKAGDPRTMARVRDSRARWLADTASRQDEAIAEVDLGLEAARRAGDAGQVAGLLAVRSTFLSRQGRLGEALADAMRARDAAARAGPRAEVTALFVLAQAHAHVSDFGGSARLWTDAIARYRAIGPPIGVALALDARCHVYYELGRHDLAIADARAAIDAFTALGQRPLAPLYSRTALALIRLGQPGEARAWLDEAEDRLPSAPPFEQAQALQQVGQARLLLGEAAAAREAFDRLRALGRARGSLEDEWKAQFGLGRAALVAGDAPAAVPPLSEAADLVERLRRTVPAEELRAAYLARRVEAHEWLAAALMAQSRDPSDTYASRAFDVAERARVRALADLLAESRVRAGDRAAVEAPRALGRIEIASRLAPGEALVEYLVGDERAFGWLVTRDELVSFALPSPRQIETDTRLMLALVAADDVNGLRRLGERLTPTLLGPVLSRLGVLRRIVFVPDGPLQRLPWSALLVPGPAPAYLAARVAVSTVGSGSLLELLNSAARPGRRDLIAIAPPRPRGRAAKAGSADVPLAEALAEIREVSRIVGPQSDVIDAGTETALKASALGGYRIVHVAAHAVADERMPRDSAVLLGSTTEDDGALHAPEIAGLSLDADLVVLAACRTQVGRLLRGEGLLSLARAFTQAGARAVVASLWDVGDASTRALMRAFYERLRAGEAPDEALGAAQMRSAASGPYGAPRHWAGFVVSGEGRRPLLTPASPATRPSWLPAGVAAAVVLALGLLANREARRRRLA